MIISIAPFVLALTVSCSNQVRLRSTFVNKSHPDRIKAKRSGFMGCLAELRPTHPAHFLPQPLDSLDPLRDAHEHHPHCLNMAFSSPFRFETATYEQPHVVYRHHDTQLKCIRHTAPHLPFPPHRIPTHRKSEESTFIPRSKVRYHKGHVERSEDRKTYGWR